MKSGKICARIYVMKFEVIWMLDKIRDFINKGDNSNSILIIIGLIVFTAIILTIIIILNAKKKKLRKELEVLRKRIIDLKQHEVIMNYTAYDNLKNDPKLGMLVLRWKKEIEKLIREVDAQYSLLDVLEDAIEQNNYQNFIKMKTVCDRDVTELEQKADKFKDEIIQYIDMASDNRKYISKYHDMTLELKALYVKNAEEYSDNKEKVDLFFQSIENKFAECKAYVQNGEFVDADNIASNIFKDIKVLENYIKEAPRINHIINTEINPKFTKLKQLASNFTEQEFNLLNINFEYAYNTYQAKLQDIITDINDFKIDDYDTRLKEINDYLDSLIRSFEEEIELKNYIETNLKQHQESIVKVENTANNFIAIFNIVQGSYNITEREVQAIQSMLDEVAILKERLYNLAEEFNEHVKTNDELKQELDDIMEKTLVISKKLDDNLVLIDEIYQDEQEARKQIALLTDKLNGTKKYIKYAYFDEQQKYLNIIKQLNLKLTDLYLMLGAFPIDIVKLNEAVKYLAEEIERTTQEINTFIYKMLLTEFMLVYVNRYYHIPEYQNDLNAAEELFYRRDYVKAYEKVSSVLDSINPNEKKLVLEKYQAQFNRLFQ